METLKKKVKKSRIARNFITLLFGSGIGSIIGIINLSIVLKAIGAEQNGMIIIIQTYVSLFAGVFSFKSFEAIIKHLAVTIEEQNIEKTKKYIKLSFMLDVTSAMVAMIFAFIFLDFGFEVMGWNIGLKPFVSIYIITLVFNVTGTPIGIIRIYNKFDKMVKIGVGVSSIKLGLLIIGLLMNKTFEYFFFVELLITILNNILITIQALMILYEKNLLSFWKVNNFYDKEYFKFNVYSSLYTTIDLPVQQITTFMINKYLGFADVSVYNVFIKIASVVLKIEAPLSQIVYPEMNIRIAKGEKKSAVKLYKKLFKMIFGIGILIITIMIGTYSYWMKYFLENFEAYKIGFILYMIYVVYTSASRSIHDLFISLGYIKLNLKILVIVNTIYLILLYLLIIELGLNGVIIALCIQASMVIEVKKYILRYELRA